MKIPLSKLSWTSLAVAALLAGCASRPTMKMESGERIPAAEGHVAAKQGDNGNTKVQVAVKHLAKPEQVEEEASTYVVWAQDANGGDVYNLGALQLNDNLEGKLDTITPLKRFDVFVTAEPVATTRYPSGYKALWTHVEQE